MLERNLKGRLPDLLIKAGSALILAAGVFFVVAFYPSIVSETKYLFLKPNEDAKIIVDPNPNLDNKTREKYYIKPADPEFGLVIPKIGANSKVVPNVNAYDPKIYQQALTKGVAHAEGTVFPGQIGNIFVFSHSSSNFYEANKYNSVFYLLRKLNADDFFYFTYQGKVYKYKVRETKIVEPEEVEYLTQTTSKKQATLMTCWPPGTTLKRLLVVGELVEQN